MTVSTCIEGLTVTPLRQFNDARGSVLQMLRADAADFQTFGECYFSEIVPGALKAWKRHRRQTQNLAAPVGRVRFVVFDARESSPTRGRYDVIEIGRPDTYARLRIPPMVYYGFTCTSEVPALVANCVDIPHDPTESDALAFEELDNGRALALLRGLLPRPA